MIKLIIIVLVGWLCFVVLKKIGQSIKSADIPTNKSSIHYKIVACSVCETHIPESEAIIHNGKTYCSKKHL